MPLTFVGSSLPFVLVATMAFGQQVKPSQQATQPSAVKDSGTTSAPAKVAPKSQTHPRVVQSKRRRVSSRRGAKRPAYRPEYTQTSVEVMNGASTQKVVFKNDEASTGSNKNMPAPLKVEVVNGTSTDTQYFYAGNGQTLAQQSAALKRPVVVAIQSSDTRVVGGNKHPVVTGITAVGPGDAKSASSGGPKVATGVAPQPKRPAYQPDAH